MTDFYTKACFQIPCTQEQADCAINALNEINNSLTDHAKQILRKAANYNFTPTERILRNCYFQHPEYVPGQIFYNDLEWDFDIMKDDQGLTVEHDESINTEHAAIFTQAILAIFDIPHLVVIEATHTGSRSLPGAYGGHAVAVTKNSIRFHNLQSFITAELAAHNKRLTYFIGEMTEINGDIEYKSQFLMACHQNESPDQKLHAIFTTFRDETFEQASEDRVTYTCGLAAKDPNYTAITPLDFHILSQHLPVL